MRATAMILVAALAGGGCEKKKGEPEPTYQSRPLSAWVQDTKDADINTRLKSYEALSAMGARTPQVEAALRSGVQSEEISINHAAAFCLRDVYGDSGPAVEITRKYIVAAEKSRDVTDVISLDQMVERLGPDAAKLSSELKAVAEVLPQSKYRDSLKERVAKLR